MRLVALVLLVAALPGCATRGDVPSFVAAGYAERRYEGVALLANFADLRVRGTLERLLDDGLARGGRRVVQCSSLMFPETQHSHEETLETVRGEDLPALLVLDPTESYEVRWIPLQIDDNEVTRSVVGGQVASEETRSRTVQLTRSRRQEYRIRARLMDMKTGRAVWLVDDVLGGFGLGAMENLVEHVVDGLAETRVLGP